MRPLLEYERCHRGEPCGMVCLDRAPAVKSWDAYLREPGLAPLWTGDGQVGPTLDLPEVIPAGSLRVKLRAPPAGWVAVDACDLFALAPGRCSPKPCARSRSALREALGASDQVRVLVYLNAPDPHLEGLFAHGPAVAEVVANLRPDLVGAPSFSLYDSRPGIDQVYQQRRMFTLLGELERAGASVFPNVYVADEADVERWQEWLARRSRVWVIGSVVQAMDPRYFERTIRALARLQAGCAGDGRRLKTVLYGLSSPHRVLEVREYGLTDFTCVSSQAAMTACHGRSLARRGWRFARLTDAATDRHKLLSANVDVERTAIHEAMRAPAGAGRATRPPAPPPARPPRPKPDSRQLSLFGRGGRAAGA